MAVSPTPPQPEGAGPQQYQRHQQHQQQPPSAAGSSTPKDIREFLRTPHTRQQPQQQSQHHQQHQQQQQQPHQQRQQQQQHQQQYQQQPHQHQQQPPSAAGSSTPKDIREFLRTPPHMGDGCFAGSSTAATPGAGGAAAPPRPGKRMAGAQRGAGSGVLPFGSPTPPTPPHHQQPTAWGTPPAQPQQQQQQHTPSSWFGQSPCAGPAASSLRQAAGAQHSAQRTAGKATVSTRQQSSGVSASMNWDAPAAPEVGKGKKRNVNAPGSGGVFSSLAWDDDNGASVLANTFRAKNQQGGGDGKVARLSAKQKNILKKKLATTTPVDDPLKCPDAHRGKLRKTAFQRSAEELHDPRWDAAASGRGTLRKTPFQQALSEGDLQDPKWSADRGKLRKSAWEQSVTEAPVEDGLKWGGGAGVGGVGGGERPPQAGKSQAQLRRDKEEAANQRNLGKKAEKGEKLFGMSPQEASDRAAEKRQEEAAAKTSRPKFQRGGAAQQKGAPRGLYDKMASREKEVNRDTAKQKESQFQEQRMRSESRRQFAQRVAEEFRQQQQKRKASEAAKEERRKSEDARQEAEAAETGHRCRGTQTETTGRAFPKPQPPPQGGARKCNIFG